MQRLLCDVISGGSRAVVKATADGPLGTHKRVHSRQDIFITALNGDV